MKKILLIILMITILPIVCAYELEDHIAFSTPYDLPLATTLFSGEIELAYYDGGYTIYLLGSNGKVWTKINNTSTNKTFWSVENMEIKTKKKPIIVETNGEYIIHF